MVLLPNILIDGLKLWLEPQAPTPVQAAQKFADAHKAYIQTATAPTPPNPATVEVASKALASTMAGVFTVGVPTAFTQGIESGLIAFWTTLGAGGFLPGISAVTLPTLQPTLLPALVAGMAGAPSAIIATQLGTAIDIWTRTITIVQPPPLLPIPVT